MCHMRGRCEKNIVEVSGGKWRYEKGGDQERKERKRCDVRKRINGEIIEMNKKLKTKNTTT